MKHVKHTAVPNNYYVAAYNLIFPKYFRIYLVLPLAAYSCSLLTNSSSRQKKTDNNTCLRHGAAVDTAGKDRGLKELTEVPTLDGHFDASSHPWWLCPYMGTDGVGKVEFGLATLRWLYRVAAPSGTV